MAGEFTLSGYKATATTYLSTELDSLGDGANKLGGVIANDTNKYLYHDITISLASVAFVDTPHVKVYLLAEVDGTDGYPDGADATDPELINLVATISIRAATAAQVLVARDISLPNGNFKYLLISEAGIALAVSGNTFKYRPHNGAYT